MSLAVGDLMWSKDQTRLYEVNKILKPDTYELWKIWDATGDYSGAKYTCIWTPEECKEIDKFQPSEERLFRMLFR